MSSDDSAASAAVGLAEGPASGSGTSHGRVEGHSRRRSCEGGGLGPGRIDIKDADCRTSASTAWDKTVSRAEVWGGTMAVTRIYLERTIKLSKCCVGRWKRTAGLDGL